MNNIKKEALDLVQDALLKSKRESDLDWTEIKEKHPIMEHSSDILRRYGTAWKMLEEWGLVDFSQIKISDYETPKYKESVELTKDGTQKSDKLIELSETDMKDEDAVLKAHGYDPDIWEIINAKNSIFNVNAKGGITKTLYSSKITVKKRVNGINTDRIIDSINSKADAVYIPKTTEDGSGLLEITYKDMHWGIADFKYYKPVLDKTLDKIGSKSWKQILIVVGSDLLHNDGFTGQTTSGTIIDKVDMEQAWEDAFLFYSILIRKALNSSENVHIMFCEGNHDQSMGWAFVKALEAKFPSNKNKHLTYDTARKTRKAFVWEGIFLGITHGDKAYNKLSNNFLTEFGKQIAQASIVEIHHGHIHHETLKDAFGIVTRSLASGAKTDDYHYENGYIGANKRFQLFEYSENHLEDIRYINI